MLAELLIALPGEGDFLVRVPKREFGIESRGLFVGKVFGSDLQGAADPVERVSLPSAVSEGVLLDPAPDLGDHGRSEFDDVESVQDGDGFGEFITDRVGVAAERIQRGGLDPGGELGSACLEPVRVGLPGPARNEVQQSCMHHAVLVAGWSTMPVTIPVPGGPVWDQTCSSTPSASTPVSLPVAEIRPVALLFTASQTVCQETPSWWARAETEVSKCCSASVAQAAARAVSFALGPASA